MGQQPGSSKTADELVATSPREVLHDEVHRSAAALMSTLGPRLIALVVKSANDVVLPPTPTRQEPERLADRLDAGAPLTPLADPEASDGLAEWRPRPSSVRDLLNARGTDGRRIDVELRQQCASQAAGAATVLAHQLMVDHPDLAARITAQRPPEAGPAPAGATAVCAEVAALLAIELVNLVDDQLADQVVTLTDTHRIR